MVLTNIQTPLFGSVLSGVPVLPVFQLIFSALLLSKHHHHYTLEVDEHNVNLICYNGDSACGYCQYSCVATCFRFIFIFLSYPDFGDGLLHAFVVNLPEGDRVKLAFVEVRHRPVTCLLTQRFGRLKSVLEVIPKI